MDHLLSPQKQLRQMREGWKNDQVPPLKMAAERVRKEKKKSRHEQEVAIKVNQRICSLLLSPSQR